ERVVVPARRSARMPPSVSLHSVVGGLFYAERCCGGRVSDDDFYGWAGAGDLVRMGERTGLGDEAPATRTSSVTVGRFALEIRRESGKGHRYQCQRLECCWEWASCY